MFSVKNTIPELFGGVKIPKNAKYYVTLKIKDATCIYIYCV